MKIENFTKIRRVFFQVFNERYDYPFRKHPEFRKKKQPTIIQPELDTPMEESDFVTPEVVENDFQDHAENREALPDDNDLIYFGEQRDDIFKNIFAKIMRSKIMHNAAEECINEIMDAFLDASQKSNVLFQEKLKQAIEIEVQKLQIGISIICSKII